MRYNSEMNEVIEILQRTGAIIPNGHFVGVSGLHFDTYIDKYALFTNTEETSKIGKLFAEAYTDRAIEVVAAPALGGILLSQWVAHHLSIRTGRPIISVFTMKTEDKGQRFGKGYDRLVRGKRTLIVEDNVSTGGSVMKVAKAVKDAGGEVLEICAMLNRDPDKVSSETLGVPFRTLCEYPVTMYQASECPMCKAKIPVNIAIGHGKEFVDKMSMV